MIDERLLEGECETGGVGWPSFGENGLRSAGPSWLYRQQHPESGSDRDIDVRCTMYYTGLIRTAFLVSRQNQTAFSHLNPPHGVQKFFVWFFGASVRVCVCLSLYALLCLWVCCGAGWVRETLDVSVADTYYVFTTKAQPQWAGPAAR